ncbi:MAG: hypothetical protein SCARUB_03514 [Candidatus Scalindua rubra]|uniref:Uncharacterized protein n=1 Tax=Candidatus Scalindua rubra TaxID=1872076 RepID=A0A1E3X6Y1_9BACT|nr:MAG: hypothetical protein SCARUB_03514 [Candidatus Scalindua rubra]
MEYSEGCFVIGTPTCKAMLSVAKLTSSELSSGLAHAICPPGYDVLTGRAGIYADKTDNNNFAFVILSTTKNLMSFITNSTKNYQKIE